jgi:hypothetical protein
MVPIGVGRAAIESIAFDIDATHLALAVISRHFAKEELQ